MFHIESVVYYQLNCTMLCYLFRVPTMGNNNNKLLTEVRLVDKKHNILLLWSETVPVYRYVAPPVTDDKLYGHILKVSGTHQIGQLIIEPI